MGKEDRLFLVLAQLEVVMEAEITAIPHSTALARSRTDS
jgi:hypothetical protein